MQSNACSFQDFKFELFGNLGLIHTLVSLLLFSSRKHIHCLAEPYIKGSECPQSQEICTSLQLYCDTTMFISNFSKNYQNSCLKSIFVII